MTPKGTSEFALGNLITCDIQGMMSQLGLSGSIFYTFSLAVYYVAIIKFNRKEKDISKKLFEYMLHFIPNGFAFVTAFFLAAKRQYGPLADGHICWLGVYPRNCLADPDVECERGSLMSLEYAKWFAVIPFLVIYFLVLCTMMIVCHHIVQQRRKADRWRMQSGEDDSASCCCIVKREKLLQRNQNCQEFPGDDEIASSASPAQTKFLKMQQAILQKGNTIGDQNTSIPCDTNATTSRSGTRHDPLAFNVHQVKRKIRRESMLDRDAPIILSSKIPNEKPLRRSRANNSRDELAHRKDNIAITQCLLYVSSFLLCWIFPAIARVYGIMRSPVPFPVLVLSRIFNPLQGFFFILVYSRPHVKSIQNRNHELYWLQAFAIAFKAGGDNDFGDNRLEVVDEESIDAPRLRDSERERRQEIVRQQFKRKSVTYPRDVEALLKQEEIERQSLEVSVAGVDNDERESMNRFKSSNDISDKDSPMETKDNEKEDSYVDTLLSDTEAGRP